MPARKPQSLNSRHDTNADKAARARREESTAGRPLAKAPPPALAKHAVAAATWRRLLREFGELESQLATRLDQDLLVDYCLQMEQVSELDHMRTVAHALWLKLSGEHDRLSQAGQYDAAISIAVSVVGAFDAVLKLDARADVKRKGLLGLRQALYLTPRSRAGAAPAAKPAPEPADEMEDMLRDLDLDPREAKKK